MTKYADIAVRGSVQSVQQLVQGGFTAHGFRVQWQGLTKGKAEKGSKGKNIALGALAQYYAVEFEILAGNGVATLRLHKANSGWMGGYLGARSVEHQFTQLCETLSSWFQQQGSLVGMQKG